MAQCRRTADLDEPSTYPIIFGRAEHRAYTLLDTFSLSTREFDADERIERILVNRYLGGAWFDDPGRPMVDRLIVTMRHLPGWVDQSGIQVEWPASEGSCRRATGSMTKGSRSVGR